MCCEDQPLPTTTDTPTGADVIHVTIDALWGRGSDTAVMWCGLVVSFCCGDVDFFREVSKRRATCGGCRAALGARSML